MVDPERTLERLRYRIEGSYRMEEVSEADYQAIREFDDALMLLVGSEYGLHRIVKLLRHVTIMAEEVGGVANALEDRDAAEDLVRWINSTYTDSEETNQDYRVALKVFGRRVSEENGTEPPDSLDWIPSSTSSNYDPSPEPANMLKWETDIQAMIEEAHTSRDKAAIAVQFDAGTRGFEFRDMTVGDVTEGPHGKQITVGGKQGKRTVTLIPSGPYLNQWLADHPTPDDPDAPLWSKLSEPERPSYRMLCKIFERAGERAEVSKPITLTNFRKSSASHLASRGVNQATLEDHHGWVRGSDAAARYIAIFDDATDREIARAHGREIDEEDEADPTAPIVCPRCDRDTPRERDLCVWCGQALDQDAARQAAAFDDLIAQSLANAQGKDAERLLEFQREARDNPDLRSQAIDEISGLLEQHS